MLYFAMALQRVMSALHLLFFCFMKFEVYLGVLLNEIK